VTVINKYRVDAVEANRVPCGMNTIIYLGDNKRSAQGVFIDRASSDRPAILSEWRTNLADYVIIANTADKQEEAHNG